MTPITSTIITNNMFYWPFSNCEADWFKGRWKMLKQNTSLTETLLIYIGPNYSIVK